MVDGGARCGDKTDLVAHPALEMITSAFGRSSYSVCYVSLLLESRLNATKVACAPLSLQSTISSEPYILLE